MIRTPYLYGATDLRCHKPTSLGSDIRGKVESIRCFRCSYEPPSYVVVNSPTVCSGSMLRIEQVFAPPCVWGSRFICVFRGSFTKESGSPELLPLVTGVTGVTAHRTRKRGTFRSPPPAARP